MIPLFRYHVFLEVVYRIAPIAVLRHPAAYNIEIHLSQTSCYIAHFARTDQPMIDAGDCADLRSRSTEEHFIGKIKFSTINLPFLYLDSELFLNQLDHRTPGNTFENIVRDWRGCHHTIPKDEEVRRRAFGDVAISVKNDRFVKAGAYGVGLDERRIDIRTCNLAPGRNRVVIDPAPRRNGYMHDKSEDALAAAVATKDLLQRNGHTVEILSGASTGTYNIDSYIEGLTELQSGSYVFMPSLMRYLA